MNWLHSRSQTGNAGPQKLSWLAGELEEAAATILTCSFQVGTLAAGVTPQSSCSCGCPPVRAGLEG